MMHLPRIRTGLLKHPLDSQMLVYDPNREQVHLLDRTTSIVLELLQDGGWTREGISVEIADRLGAPANAALLDLAIDELHKAGLVEPDTVRMEGVDEVNRRTLLKQMAAAGAAALLIPAVTTLTATRGYAQGTALFGVGTACSLNTQCASGLCCNGICSNTGCPQTPGAICTANNQCGVGGSCCNGTCSNTLKPNGASCTGSATSCGEAATNANATCCSGLCAGSCPPGGGSTKTHTGVCSV